jgi:multidrug efflux system membrane fusion protein
LAAGTGGYFLYAKGAGEPVKAAPKVAKLVPVLVAPAAKQSVPVEISVPGVVQAQSTVAVKAQITGMLTKVCFAKGQELKKDQLLFEIDPRPFQATLEQLRAGKARDQAQLENVRGELARQTELSGKGIVSASDFDKAKTDVTSFEATIKADDAAINNALLQLEYCTIRSPIDGRAGDVLVDAGNLIKIDDMSLLTINQVQPIQVYFSIAERDLPAVRTHMAGGKLRVRATIPGACEPAEEGELAFVDNAVDASTAMIRLGAAFPNKQERLWPGQYVDVVLTLRVQADAIVVPTKAVQTGVDGGLYVFAVAANAAGEKVAQARPVTISRSRDGLVVIETGLAGGEQIVTDGQARLVPGAKVLVTEPAPPGGPASCPQSCPASRPAAGAQAS